VVVISAGIAFGLARTDWQRGLENIYYDYWHVKAGIRYEPAHTAFISMDDETLLALRGRPTRVLGAVFRQGHGCARPGSGVKAVGLDFIYQVSAEEGLRKLKLPNSEISRTLRRAPARPALCPRQQDPHHPRGHQQRWQGDQLFPPKDHLILLPQGVFDLGVANLEPDSDKYVRRFPTFLDETPRSRRVGFGMQLALRAAGPIPPRRNGPSPESISSGCRRCARSATPGLPEPIHTVP